MTRSIPSGNRLKRATFEQVAGVCRKVGKEDDGRRRAETMISSSSSLLPSSFKPKTFGLTPSSKIHSDTSPSFRGRETTEVSPRPRGAVGGSEGERVTEGQIGGLDEREDGELSFFFSFARERLTCWVVVRSHDGILDLVSLPDPTLLRRGNDNLAKTKDGRKGRRGQAHLFSSFTLSWPGDRTRVSPRSYLYVPSESFFELSGEREDVG